MVSSSVLFAPCGRRRLGPWGIRRLHRRPIANPISLPNYPSVGGARNDRRRASSKDDWLWLVDKQQQFRELADVSVLWHEGHGTAAPPWIWRGRARMVGRWRHHPLNIRDVGYARRSSHKGRFLLMASESSVYVADSPLGPFQEIGPIKLPKGLPAQIDPMLFSDDDGRLFYYWGCTPTEGILAGADADKRRE